MILTTARHEAGQKPPAVSIFGNKVVSLPMKHEIMDNLSFKLVLTEEAVKFIEQLPRKAADKVYYNIHRVAKGERNNELFKKLEGTEIWEFRTLHNSIAYRLFAFWDTEEETLVIATHGIIKKTQKTPQKEIAKAEAIRKEYFNNKH